MSDVHVEDGRRVDEADGHHVKVGVGVLPNREGRRCYSGLWPWYRYHHDGDVDGMMSFTVRFNRWSWWWWRRSSQSERLSCGERCRRWWSSGWFDEESDFGVVVVVLGFKQSRLLCEGLFIRKNCVLKECLRFNVELVKRFRIRISRKFLVFWNSRRILMAATGGVVVLKMLYEMWRIGV